MQDIWEYKDPSCPKYPTEKNIEMVKKIILSSSNPESTILDCFCGSGTTVIAAQELGRNWIGVDESEKSIEIIKNRLNNVKRGLYDYNKSYEFITIDK